MTEKQYPPLPKPGRYYTHQDMLDYVDADRAMRAVRAAPDGLPLVIAGAIYDFAGFLTTRPQVIHVGASAEATPIADLVKEWAAKRGLSLKDAAVLSWQELLTTPQEAAPYVAGPNTRAKMEEWLEEGTLIDRVAEVLTLQENEILRLEKLVKEQPAPSQELTLFNPRRALEIFKTAQAGSSRDVGTLRGIMAVLSDWESRPDPHGWLVTSQDAEDAARLDWLEQVADGSTFTNVCRVVSVHGSWFYKPVGGHQIERKSLREIIDAARAQQEGK